MDVDTLCLASSNRGSGRCVAGVMDDGAWIRPVSGQGADALFPIHHPGVTPKVFDWLRIPLAEREPEPWQPENWRVSGGAWETLRQGSAEDMSQIIRPLVVDESPLFGTTTRSISVEALRRAPLASSLRILGPRRLVWHVERDRHRRRRFRLQFDVGEDVYRLPVTDPDVLWKSKQLEADTSHGHGQLWEVPDDRTLLVISLSAPLEGACYKLVAAVIFLSEAGAAAIQ